MGIIESVATEGGCTPVAGADVGEEEIGGDEIGPAKERTEWVL